MKNLLDCSEVGFRYTDRTVLKGISLSLEAASCTALVGPNGAGKTTLLRLLSGALEVSSGHVTIDDKPLAQLSRKERSRLIALAPQQFDVPFEFTVRQIVEQGRAPYLGLLRGLDQEDRLAVERAMDQTDVASFSDRIFNELSGGERQRVKIALGLAQQPKILLLDEPTQNMDVGRQAELIDLLHYLCSEGITVLASMHDLHLVHGNFERVHLLEPGVGLTSGSPQQVLTASHLSRAFRCSRVDDSFLGSYVAAQASSI